MGGTMPKAGFPITGSIIFAAGVVLGLAAFGGDTSLPTQNISERITLHSKPAPRRMKPGQTRKPRSSFQARAKFPRESKLCRRRHRRAAALWRAGAR